MSAIVERSPHARTVIVARDPRALCAKLPPRQFAVLLLMAEGLTNKQIGMALGISWQTVNTHVSRILRALDVANRTQAAALLMRFCENERRANR